LLLLYVCTARIPGEKAHSIQIVRTCRAFAEAGCYTYLITPRKDQPIEKLGKVRFEDFYGFNPNFTILKAPSIDLLKIGSLERITHKILSLSASLSILPLLVFFSILKGEKVRLLYVRERLIFLALTLLKPLHGFKLIFELHRPFETKGLLNKALIKLLPQAKLVVVISNVLKEFLLRLGVPGFKVHVAHSGIEVKELEVDESEEEVRLKLRLPLNRKIALYVGHLYGERNVEGLLQALRLTASSVNNLSLLIVGGMNKTSKD